MPGACTAGPLQTALQSGYSFYLSSAFQSGCELLYKGKRTSFTFPIQQTHVAPEAPAKLTCSSHLGLQLLLRQRRELLRTGRVLTRLTVFSPHPCPCSFLALPYFLKPLRTKTFVREPQEVAFLHPSCLRERNGWPSIQSSLCGICLSNYLHLNLLLSHNSFSWAYTCAQVSFL